MSVATEESVDKRDLFTIPVQWDKCSFPKSRANIAVITLNSTLEVVSKDERDVLRHLCDDDAVGHMFFVQNAEDASRIKVPKAPAPIPGRRTQGQRIRAVLAVEYQSVGLPYGPSDAGYERYYVEQTEAYIQERKEGLPARAGGY